MAKTLNKSGKKLVKKKGKDGRVRAYWMGQKDTPKRMRQGAAPEKQGFLQKHGGKLAAGAALLGVAALNRHKLAGALRGAGLAHNAIKNSGQAVGLKDHAHSMFRMAKVGFMSNRGMDGIDKHMDRAGSLARSARGAMSGYRANAGQHVKNWRQGIGSQLAGHMTETLGGAAAEHLGSRFGSVAGTAVGSMFGPAGAALGGFVGGHAGGFLGGRHAAPHIQKAARWAAQRMAQR